MEEIFDSIVHLKEQGWTEDQAKALFRRFIPIGTAEEIDKFLSLAEEKNLSREDLRVILRAIKLNPAVDDVAMDVVMEKMADGLSKILSSAHIPE